MRQKIKVTARLGPGCDDAHCDDVYATEQEDMVLIQGTVVPAGDAEGVEGMAPHEGLLLISRATLRAANL